MRDPDTQSVQAFRDLLADNDTSPWYVNVMAPDLAATAEIVDRLEALPEVGRTISLLSYVPKEQEEKLAILEDLAFLMDAPPLGRGERVKYGVEEQIDALRLLNDVLHETERPADDAAVVTSLDSLESRLSNFLVRVEDEADPAQALIEFRDILLERLPEAIERFRNMLTVEPVELSNLPPELVRRMLAPDGTARIQAFPAEALQDYASLKKFATSVLSVAPRAAGIAPNLVDLGDATARSFRLALISAAIAISALLFLLWQRPGDVAIVLTTLALGSILTCASMALLGVDFNFANVLVLPLLFGIGVDSGIHLVHRARYDAENPDDSHGSLIETATAGAVFYSAMTTTLSFGTLALSGHKGMQGLGIMLTIGMFWTIVANLIVLPALLVVCGISPMPQGPVSDASASEP
jgi:predicted RND superfamily exporter protein